VRRPALRQATVAVVFMFPLLLYSCWFGGPGRDESLLGAPRGTVPTVRVLLAGHSGERAPAVEVQGRYSLREAGSERLIGGTYNSGRFVVRNEGHNVHLGRRATGLAAVEVAPHKGSRLWVNNVPYRGKVRFVCDGAGAMRVVNVVGLEAYLAGVVSKEMPPDWPIQALEAQAIAARTYALYELARRQDKTYDVKDTQASQVYGGVQAECQRSTQAVLNTYGLVLAYQSGGRPKPFKTYYHSTCGGHTTSAYRVWQTDNIPPLQGVPCTYCASSPVYRWTLEMSADEIGSALSGQYAVGKIAEIRPIAPDESGYVLGYEVRHSRGTTRIMAERFRSLIGYSALKSARTKIYRKGDGFIFAGQGWGHGVGLCQYGARGLASQGKNGQDIARYYYPGAQIVKWY